MYIILSCVDDDTEMLSLNPWIRSIVVSSTCHSWCRDRNSEDFVCKQKEIDYFSLFFVLSLVTFVKYSFFCCCWCSIPGFIIVVPDFFWEKRQPCLLIHQRIEASTMKSSSDSSNERLERVTLKEVNSLEKSFFLSLSWSVLTSVLCYLFSSDSSQGTKESSRHKEGTGFLLLLDEIED